MTERLVDPFPRRKEYCDKWILSPLYVTFQIIMSEQLRNTLTLLECVDQAVLISSSQLAQHHNHLDLWDVLVADAVVTQGGAGEGVTTDGNACTHMHTNV